MFLVFYNPTLVFFRLLQCSEFQFVWNNRQKPGTVSSSVNLSPFVTSTEFCAGCLTVSSLSRLSKVRQAGGVPAAAAHQTHQGGAERGAGSL